MIDAFTGTLNLTKPEVGGSRDAWGAKWNDNADKIDAAIKANADAVKNIPPGVPAGAMMFFGMGTPPAGWLKCNGASLLRASYPALFAAIGTQYGAADGNSFNVPDVRGLFPRVLDDGRGIDGGRGIGSFQDYAIPPHYHPTVHGATYFITVYASAGPANIVYNNDGSQPTTYGYDNISSNAAGVPNASESRPKNIAFPMFIKI